MFYLKYNRNITINGVAYGLRRFCAHTHAQEICR